MKISAILIKCLHLYAWASSRHINYMVMMSKFFSIFQNCEYWFEGKFKKKNCNLEPPIAQGVRIRKVGRLCLCNSHITAIMFDPSSPKPYILCSWCIDDNVLHPSLYNMVHNLFFCNNGSYMEDHKCPWASYVIFSMCDHQAYS